MSASYRYPGHHIYDGIIYHHHVLPTTLTKIKDELLLDPSDVVVATYPKSGTTWTLDLVHTVDVGLAKSRERTEVMDHLFPFIEHKGRDQGQVPPYDVITSRAAPRRIKTHLPASFYARLLSDPEHCPNFIVTLRNPKDTLISFFHHHQILPKYEFDSITWDDFFTMFKEKKIHFGDIIDYNLGWWAYRDHPRVSFLRYEKMLTDNEGVKQIAQILARDLTEHEVDLIGEFCSFEQMKSRGLKSYHQGAPYFDESRFLFFRKGERGDWRNFFSDEQSQYVDELMRTLCEPVGLYYQC